MKYCAIITAGGTSSRYGERNKLLEKINDKEVIKYSTDIFLSHPNIEKVIICANILIIPTLKELFRNELSSKLEIIEGGQTRQESVYNGLKAILDCEYVLIHDGARPVITTNLIDKILKEVEIKKALTVATKTTDTIKIVERGRIVKTLDRDLLYNIQTPQAFEYNLIKTAHEKFIGQSYSDDAGLIEAMREPVYILENDYTNIKITTKNDLEIAKTYLKTM